ncbi:uncharacterized protein MONBRDRAFT_11341 [Monosiga brevicollis MX1]|uniref:Membrane-associated protein n=1 Tax=Monosiga brevicollis TaxID=81824 RepID=A9V8Y6_MONBE|nr:uncharacterized protein MONBRDRAFT_11341 [Monosiga brevicollis MX1]EDQ85957.1 predicted protein [Monosiga brevicollis MX1]|eukprot:XP_001749151.1 hypothetical protein [Monosiga brevicollis MX1]
MTSSTLVGQPSRLLLLLLLLSTGLLAVGHAQSTTTLPLSEGFPGACTARCSSYEASAPSALACQAACTQPTTCLTTCDEAYEHGTNVHTACFDGCALGRCTSACEEANCTLVHQAWSCPAQAGSTGLPSTTSKATNSSTAFELQDYVLIVALVLSVVLLGAIVAMIILFCQHRQRQDSSLEKNNDDVEAAKDGAAYPSKAASSNCNVSAAGIGLASLAALESQLELLQPRHSNALPRRSKAGISAGVKPRAIPRRGKLAQHALVAAEEGDVSPATSHTEPELVGGGFIDDEAVSALYSRPTPRRQRIVYASLAQLRARPSSAGSMRIIGSNDEQSACEYADVDFQRTAELADAIDAIPERRAPPHPGTRLSTAATTTTT